MESEAPGEDQESPPSSSGSLQRAKVTDPAEELKEEADSVAGKGPGRGQGPVLDHLPGTGSTVAGLVGKVLENRHPQQQLCFFLLSSKSRENLQVSNRSRFFLILGELKIMLVRVPQ